MIQKPYFDFFEAMIVLKLAEKIFIVLSLLFFSDAIFPLLEEVGGIPINPIMNVCFLGIQAGLILLLVAWWRKVFRNALKEKLLWVLLGIVVFSVFWSDVPTTTLGSIRNLVPAILLGVYLAARYTLKEQLQLLAWMLSIAALLSVVCSIVLPSYGVMGMAPNSSAEALSHMGAWRGIFSHKNDFGRIMDLSAVVFLLLAANSRKYRWLLWAGFSLSIGLILLSTSKTALIIFLTIVFLLPFYRALRWNYTLAIPFFIIVVLAGGSVAILLLGNAEAILGALGRDLTFTGRTDLWVAVLDKIWQRPWLGYGYYGFWQVLGGESTDVLKTVHWEAPHSHNGLLDLWLDLGLLGLSVFVLTFIAVCLRSVTWVRLNKTTAGFWPLAYLTFLFLANLTESSLFRQKFLWLMYVATTLSLHNKSNNLVEGNTFFQQNIKGEPRKPVTQEPLPRKV